MSKIEYLYKCPKCEREFWDTLYVTPICIHDNGVGYKMRGVCHPSHHEDPGAIRVMREVGEEDISIDYGPKGVGMGL